MTKLIKMARPDGKSADVHPDEVENFRAGGFEIAGEESPERQADPFDHDGDGKPGGSLPDVSAPVAAPKPAPKPRKVKARRRKAG